MPKARELVELGRKYGYRLDELVEIIEEVAEQAGDPPFASEREPRRGLWPWKNRPETNRAASSATGGARSGRELEFDAGLACSL